MYRIQLLNKIAKQGLDLFDDHFDISAHATEPDAILLRSCDIRHIEFPGSLLCISRAGAGVNNIPVEQCTEQGVVVFNTPGANANAVKELAVTSLFLSSRNILGGIGWVKGLTGADIAGQVEEGKAQFTGPEIEGKTLGVIGLGAIGVMVANAALDLGMHVYGHDPYLSVDAAWGLSKNVRKAEDLQTLYQVSDYISIHIPATKMTEGFINAAALDQMKNGVRIINLSRGTLVNNKDMHIALGSGKVTVYVTDFPDEETAHMSNVIAIPHLGASTPESEVNCAIMAVRQTRDYLEHGNITRSVNFPSCTLSRSSAYRLTFCHKNVPNILSQISGALAAEGLNIANMINKSKDTIAYTIVDIDTPASSTSLHNLSRIQGMAKVRALFPVAQTGL